MNKFFSVVSSLVLLLLSVPMLSPANAADVNGRIKGTITDPAGAVISGAKVIATNQATGVKFTTVSQANGLQLPSASNRHLHHHGVDAQLSILHCDRHHH